MNKFYHARLMFVQTLNIPCQFFAHISTIVTLNMYEIDFAFSENQTDRYMQTQNYT